jgi:MFS family permease
LAGALFFLPLNLTQIQRYPATIAGAAFLPTTILIALISPYAGRLSSRIGARPLLVAGPLVIGVAFFMLAIPGVTAGPTDYWLTFFPVSVVIGAGLGLTIAPLTTAVMNAVPVHEAGVASGVNNAVTRAAQVLAAAIMGAALLSIFGNALTTRLTSTALPVTVQQQLLAQSASLGNIPIPTTLSAAETTQAQQAISLSFVEAFRYIVLAAGVLAWISAAVAARFVELLIKPAAIEG